MTKQELLAAIESEKADSQKRVAALHSALEEMESAAAKAQSVQEKRSGIILKRAKRQAAVDYFDQHMRPHHDRTMQEIGNQITDWRKRFTEALNQLVAMAAEYAEIEKAYDNAMIALYQDAALCVEADGSLGAGWDETDFKKQVGEISAPAQIIKSFERLDKKALDFAGVKSALNRYPSTSHLWLLAAHSTENQKRLQAIFEGLEIWE